MSRFDHIETWIFDLDNTLYSPNCRLFDQIDVRMGAFIAERLGVDRARARTIQKDFFFRYGTTLHGLMSEHGVEPEEFLPFVHDIDRSIIPEDKALDAAIADLPGKKFICTNGTTAHATATLEALGIGDHFDDIFDIKSFGYVPKPNAVAYDVMLEGAGIDPTRAAMFEDIARNLEVPHERGMTTVLVSHDDNVDGAMINRLNGDGEHAPYVHHTTEELSVFLADLCLTEGVNCT